MPCITSSVVDPRLFVPIDGVYLHWPPVIALIVGAAAVALAKGLAWRIITIISARRPVGPGIPLGRTVPPVWLYPVDLAYAPVICMISAWCGVPNPVHDAIVSLAPVVQLLLFFPLLATWLLALVSSEFISSQLHAVVDPAALRITFWRLYILCSVYCFTLLPLFVVLFYGGLVRCPLS